MWQTAEALYAADRLAEGRAHIEQALILLGRPMPKGRGRLVAGLLIQILRQVRNRIGLDRFSSHPPETQAILLETARAYALLGEICARARLGCSPSSPYAGSICVNTPRYHRN